MSPLARLIESAKASPAHIVLPEGEDARIVEGAVRAAQEGVARITLLGNQAAVSRLLVSHGGEQSAAISVIDPAAIVDLSPYEKAYMDARKGKASAEAARAAALEPLTLAALMVRMGKADGTLGGAVATTADTVRAALQIIGKAPQSSVVSSFFLMGLPKGRGGQEEMVLFSDCGLMVDPDAAQLADIAISSAVSFSSLLGEPAKIAMLSFSTMGSAKHAAVTKVTDAVTLLRAKRPDLTVDGEMQFDAAFVPEVGASKAKGSPVAGVANVFIFPNLDAGNIGYKIAQRIGGALALGPVLQGLAKPANDLSRGCNSDDVFNMIAITANQVRLSKG